MGRLLEALRERGRRSRASADSDGGMPWGAAPESELRLGEGGAEALPPVMGIARDARPLEVERSPRRVVATPDVLVQAGADLVLRAIGGGDVEDAEVEDLDAPIAIAVGVPELLALMEELQAMQRSGKLNVETAWSVICRLDLMCATALSDIDYQAAEKRGKIAGLLERRRAQATAALPLEIHRVKGELAEVEWRLLGHRAPADEKAEDAMGAFPGGAAEAGEPEIAVAGTGESPAAFDAGAGELDFPAELDRAPRHERAGRHARLRGAGSLAERAAML